jgi:hypothetical protein
LQDEWVDEVKQKVSRVVNAFDLFIHRGVGGDRAGLAGLPDAAAAQDFFERISQNAF